MRLRKLEENAGILNVILVDVNKIKEFYKKLLDQSLFPDILINNAGTEEVKPSFDVDEKIMDKIIDTNLKGAFFSSQMLCIAIKKY